MMQKIVVFGKGGIGKTTISSNLAAAYALKGFKVLLVGCDPKHDTTVSLTEGRPIQMASDLSGFMDLRAKETEFVAEGRLGIDCVESGGPEPGIGCAGRGISRTIEMLESCGLMKEGRYDVIVFDVLGDVVCGGFAAPLRLGFADKVCIVASEELMSLYAANNIARAVKNYASNDIGLCGVIANLKDTAVKRGSIDRFAKLIGTKILAYLPRDPAVRRAEKILKTVIEDSPKSSFARKVGGLADLVWEMNVKKVRIPDPLTDQEFHEFSRRDFAGKREARPRETAPAPAALTREAPEEKRGPERKAVKPKSAAVDDRVEKALEAWAAAERKEKTAWADGPQSKQWGAPDQWRNFYADRESQRNAGQGESVDVPLVYVSHQDLECNYATPAFDDGFMTFCNFKWLQRGEREDRGDTGGIEIPTDIQEADVVQGGSKKLTEALELAIEHSKGKAAIMVQTACVPTVIGDDAVGIIERFRKKTRVPILFSSPAAGQEMDVLDYFFTRVKESETFRKSKPRPGTVNLIGFPLGKGRRELIKLLERAGIRVNLTLLPWLNVEDAELMGRAALNVVHPDPEWSRTVEKLFKDTKAKIITPVAPYGIEGTRRWLLEVAKALGSGRQAERAFKRASEDAGEEWNRERERIKGRRLGFVADAERVRRLADPKGLAGIPLVAMLKEMGFGIDYMLYLEGAAPKLEDEKTRHGVRWFKTREELDKLIREGDFDAVYSEYFFDTRLTRAGKTQFSLLDAEPGVEGAVRSAKRLANICSWDFYKRFGPGGRR